MEISTNKSDIRENLLSVKARVVGSAMSVGRNPEDVELIAVSKNKTSDQIAIAIAAGHRFFGENRIQESETKWPAILEKTVDTVLHFVGPLQSNKVKRAVQLFHSIQTVDRPKLARALAREFDCQGLKCDCFIQINTGEEPQKAGVLPADADAFIKDCQDNLDLPIVGLMCIPPVYDEAGFHFGLLSGIAERNGISKLSMGMSGDFEIAVRFGATHVRVGTAIFGDRQ